MPFYIPAAAADKQIVEDDVVGAVVGAARWCPDARYVWEGDPYTVDAILALRR